MLLLSLTACSFLNSPPSDAPESPAPKDVPNESAATLPAKNALPPAPAGTPLAALVSTSNTAFSLMDGDPKTRWRPYGHYADEGVLLRFETPTSFDALDLTSCGEGEGTFQVFFDGVDSGSPVSFGPSGQEIPGPDTPIRSIFLKVQDWSKTTCLGELSFRGADIVAPRTVLATISASSTMEPITAYRPHYLFDSRIDFGWVEGKEGLGIGEWVQADLNTPVEVHAIELWNGYQRSADHFQSNARAKRVQLFAEDKSFVFDVPDTMGSTKLVLPEPVSTSTLRIQILEATPGTRYDDLVLSEARLWDAQGPLLIRPGSTKQMAFGLLTKARNTALERLIDYHLVTPCAPEQEQLKFRSNNSFVHYSQREDSSEVFDGAWAFVGPKDNGTQLQLYGRRHRISTSWSPYGTGEVEDSTLIAGGKPLITRVKTIDKATFEPIAARLRAADDVECTYNYEELKKADAILIEGRAFSGAYVIDPSHG